MKNFIYLFIFFLISNTICQAQEDQTVVEKSLYSKEERESAIANFTKDVPSIGMTAETEKTYLDLINSNFTKMSMLNNRNSTKKELKQRFKRVLEDQQIELKKLLTYDQLKRHQKIYKPLIESIRKRIDMYQ
jgi:hypothetical protein